jgi:hypothetical protein
MRNAKEEMRVEMNEDQMAAENLRYAKCFKCKTIHIVHVSWLEPSDEYCNCKDCK